MILPELYPHSLIANVSIKIATSDEREECQGLNRLTQVDVCWPATLSLSVS